jgi:hypothetical protein
MFKIQKRKKWEGEGETDPERPSAIVGRPMGHCSINEGFWIDYVATISPVWLTKCNLLERGSLLIP